MTPCQYKVYLRKVGEKRKIMQARFADSTDAHNYAHQISRGKYCKIGLYTTVYDALGHVLASYEQGVLKN